MKLSTRNAKRISKHERVRKKIKGTPDRPRLSVYRSLKYIYAQIIDDSTGFTLASASSLTIPEIKSGDTMSVAKKVGEQIADEAKKKIFSLLYLTEEATSTTGELKPWLKEPGVVDCSFKFNY